QALALHARVVGGHGAVAGYHERGIPDAAHLHTAVRQLHDARRHRHRTPAGDEAVVRRIVCVGGVFAADATTIVKPVGTVVSREIRIRGRQQRAPYAAVVEIDGGVDSGSVLLGDAAARALGGCR